MNKKISNFLLIFKVKTYYKIDKRLHYSHYSKAKFSKSIVRNNKMKDQNRFE
jgi:hypothetical protein